MLKQFILLFILLSSFFLSNAQLAPIQLDRPDQTECPFIVPQGYIQAENGFTYENINSTATNLLYPTTLWKYGLNKNAELRIITEINRKQIDKEIINGLNPVTIGFKAKICEEKGIIPLTSFIGHLTSSNWGSKAFHTDYFAPSFRFVMQHTLSEKASLSYNLGARWDGMTARETYIYTLTTGFSLTDKLGYYIELYGFIPNGGVADHRCDGGFTYLVNNDFMLDISGGLGITKNASRNYIALGISYRFKVR